MNLFAVTDYDQKIYQEELHNFLPDKIIDIHTHVWLDSISKLNKAVTPKRSVTWPSLVAKDNPVEDLRETYRLMFPGKEVSALIFANGVHKGNIKESNDYIAQAAKKSGYPALYYSHPEQTDEELYNEIQAHGFLGLKSYLDLSKEYLPEAEIRIYDFFPHHQLNLINKLGLIIMLHIPRIDRLKDPVNLAQILEIKEKYPNIKLIIAHVGRAYCDGDVGNAFDVLSKADDLLFDFSANTNTNVFTKLIDSVGPKRILFGSDMPILRMRARRIDENGYYINLIPPGMYGDPKQDNHLREVSEEQADKLTFFMYEELLAMKEACRRTGMDSKDIDYIFYANGKNLIDDVKLNLQKQM